MDKKTSIIIQLQMDAADSSIPVSSLLRKTKIIATKLELTDFLEWANHELNGYENCKAEDLPKYRQVTGEPKAFNPYHGWQPIFFPDTETAAIFSSAPIGQAIGPMEEVLCKANSHESGGFAFSYDPRLKQKLVKAIGNNADVQLMLSEGSLLGILDAVRNAILDWSLSLEKAGILGENLEFPAGDKDKAQPVTQQIFAHNVGHVGNVYDEAKVVNCQTTEIDDENVLNFFGEIERALPLLPDEERRQIESKILSVKEELKKPVTTQDKSVAATALTSIKTICEGIAGNVAAQGIISLLSKLFA